MYRIALTMLLGDRGKFLGIVIGIALAATVMIQQPGIMMSMVSRTAALVRDVSLPDIWVMDPNVKYGGDSKPMLDTAVYRVRSVPGVEWAVPLFKGSARVRKHDGDLVDAHLVGLDDTTLIGAPPVMVQGELADLRRPDGIIVDASAARRRLARPPSTPGGEPVPLSVGDVLELNDRRATVMGICQATPNLQSLPTIYTTYSRAMAYTPAQRKRLTYVLAKARAGEPVEEVTARISAATGLAARTAPAFYQMTLDYFLGNSGILMAFGFMVAIGFVVGAAVTGQIFFNFVQDNLRTFGVLKAMGATDGLLLRMIALQALWVGFCGFGLGAGISALFVFATRGGSVMTLDLPWYLLAGGGAASLVICLLAAVIALRKVVRLEPAAVFKA